MNTTKKPKVQKPFDRDDREHQLSRFPDPWDCIPLNPYNATRTMPNGKVVPTGKAPRDPKWPTVRYVADQVIAKAMKSGANLGWRLPSTICGVDIDPRNSGDDGIAALVFELGIDLDDYPTVITGSGGRHIFMTIPKGTLVRDTLEDESFKGVEFKSKGRQLVAAGSLHPNGKPYVWDESKPSARDGIPDMPKALLTLITRPAHNAITGGGQYTPDQVAAMLATMKPENFQDHAKWLQLMQACHHASNGDARHEFTAWSVSDPAFAKDADIIGRRWDTMHSDRSGGVTFRSLLKAVHKHGDATSIPKQAIGDDFDDTAPEDAADKADAWFESDGVDPDSWADNLDDEIKSRKYDETELPSILDYAETCLLRKGVHLFQMGGRLVHPVRMDKDSADDESVRRKAGSLTIGGVNGHRLREYMIADVPLHKVTKKGVSVPFAAPMALAAHYQARGDKWALPVINGVIETPTLRRDGSVLEADGYDARSGLLLDMGGIKFPKIKAEPTHKDALHSLALLKKPFQDFPVVKNANGQSASLSVLLSAVLTALVRRTMHSAPMHGTSAPTMGTGKTLAIDVVSLIATGRLTTAMSQGANEEEDEKRLFSVLLKNDLILLVDNVKRPIEGDALCTVLTQSTWQSRILKESTTVEVPTNVLIMASGNNLTFKGDMTTRAIVCRLDARMENPETRRFAIDLKTEIPKQRVELVVAGLTLLRAYIVAGRPGLDKLQPFGRFEDWSNLVRGALVWLGEPDPCNTRAFINRDDPERGDLAQLFSAIQENIGDDEFTAKSLIDTGADCSDCVLMDAIENAVPRPTAKTLGSYLHARNGKMLDGLRLVSEYDRHKKLNTYRVRDSDK